MFNEKLLYHILGHPIPKPVTDLEMLRHRLVFNDEKIFFKDLFLGVISCLYNGCDRPPEDYRLFDKKVLSGGLVQYDPEVRSWKALLMKTAELLRENGKTLDEKRRIFEDWLPKRLGWLNDSELSKVLRSFAGVTHQNALFQIDDTCESEDFLDEIQVKIEVDDARKLFK
ncbi:MAG: hypothetical protein DRP96_07160 [Candidatus Neomarinimicrobiota bacterium]|nr:MAG: hypothetical protein DRP96_07160 [Candidatus Neomarinimicrobiota bacterium]